MIEELAIMIYLLGIAGFSFSFLWHYTTGEMRPSKIDVLACVLWPPLVVMIAIGRYKNEEK